MTQAYPKKELSPVIVVSFSSPQVEHVYFAVCFNCGIVSKNSRIFPNCSVFKKVGALPKSDKVQLPFYMGSMDKIKPNTGDLDKWKKKFKAFGFCR